MTSTAITCYAFDDHLVRVVLRDGEPWFVALDVCRAIGLRDVSDAVEKLDEDEKGRASIPTLGGEQDVLMVTESGLYVLILRSRQAMTPGTPAHGFRKWVTAEVLPQIRRTGSYTAPADEGEASPTTPNEDRNKLDKIHYALRLFGPPAARALWRALGLEWVPEMAQAGIAAPTADMNVAEFAAQRLLKRPGIVTAAGVIYQAYREWCADSGVAPLSDSSFGKMLVRLGYEKTKSNRIYYRNVIVKPVEHQADA